MQLPDYPILGKSLNKYIENAALTELACGPPKGISYVNRYFRLKFNPLKTLSKDKADTPKPQFSDTWTQKKFQIFYRESRIGRIEQKIPSKPGTQKERYSDLLLSYQYWPWPEMDAMPEVGLPHKKQEIESSFNLNLPSQVPDNSFTSHQPEPDNPVVPFELSTDTLPGLLNPPSPARIPSPAAVPVYSARTNIPEESAEELEEVAPLTELPPLTENRRFSKRFSITSIGKFDETLTTRDGPGSDSLQTSSPPKHTMWRNSVKEECLQETTPERRVDRPRLRVSFGSNILQEKDYLTTKREIKIPPRGRVSAHHVFGKHQFTQK